MKHAPFASMTALHFKKKIEYSIPLDYKYDYLGNTIIAFQIKLSLRRKYLQNAHYLVCNIAMKKVGILGGSFNPAHHGHIYISKEAVKRLGLDEVWWIVSPQNPLKSKDEMSDYNKRVEYAKNLIRSTYTKVIKISEFEKDEGLTYTCDTLKRLKQKYPKYRFVWIMGAENLSSFHRWDRWEEIMHEVPIAVFERRNIIERYSALKSRAAVCFKKYRISDTKNLLLQKVPAWTYFPIKSHTASATDIRKKYGKLK